MISSLWTRSLLLTQSFLWTRSKKCDCGRGRVGITRPQVIAISPGTRSFSMKWIAAIKNPVLRLVVRAKRLSESSGCRCLRHCEGPEFPLWQAFGGAIRSACRAAIVQCKEPPHTGVCRGSSFTDGRPLVALAGKYGLWNSRYFWVVGRKLAPVACWAGRAAGWGVLPFTCAPRAGSSGVVEVLQLAVDQKACV